MARRDDNHPDYRDCTDRDCPRYPCRVYRDGVEHGYLVGYDVGRADGYAEGYSDGHRDGYREGYDDGYKQGQADFQPKVIYVSSSG